MKKRPGRRRPADAELLLSQVKEHFQRKRNELGSATKAAKQIGVCPASFYKYLNGETLPDFEVLRRAHNEWGIKWLYIDTSEVLPIRKVRTPEQTVFSFLKALHEDDVEISQVGTEGETILHIKLKVRFPV
jgi:transcriptional regulator with XRE-family HTH domain